MSFETLNRRKFLKLTSGGIALASVFPMSTLASVAHNRREISFKNLHTGEQLQTQYFANNKFIDSELHKINHIFRDFRQNEVHQMDKKLIIQLDAIQALLKTNAEVQIISGYRSPKTNEMLRNNSSGVAKKSFHMLGKAIDFRLEGVGLDEVRDAAKSLKAGGVGYYANSNFIHIDTGAVRSW